MSSATRRTTSGSLLKIRAQLCRTASRMALYERRRSYVSLKAAGLNQDRYAHLFVPAMSTAKLRATREAILASQPRPAPSRLPARTLVATESEKGA